MEQLENGHQLLKFQHCFAPVRLKHEPECGHPRAPVVDPIARNLRYRRIIKMPQNMKYFLLLLHMLPQLH